MTFRRAHRLLSRLALVAILSLATLPTLGRMVLFAHPAPHGMAMQGHSMPMAPERGPVRSPLGHDHGGDCAYCALLSGVVPTAVVSLAVAAAPVPRFAAARPARAPVAGDLHPGLGARGPPRTA